MTPTDLRHPHLGEYLRRLERAARFLPRHERDELLTEIRGHLAAGIEEHGPGDAAVRNLLDALGDPQSIVAATGYAPAGPPRGAGPMEVLAVIMLLIGGIIIPIFGWFVGLALLWTSSAWTTHRKLLGTLVLPGGLAFPFVLMLMASPVTLPTWIGLPLLFAMLLAPVYTAAVLLFSAERPPLARPR